MLACVSFPARALVVGVVSLGLASVAVAGPVQYEMIAIGNLSDRIVSAEDLNDRGQVVGTHFTATQVQAYRTQPNLPFNPATDLLGTIDGHQSHAFGINNRGQVVGTVVPVTQSPLRFFGYRTAPDGLIEPSGTFGTNQDRFTPIAINDAGRVAGRNENEDFIRSFASGPHQPIDPVADDLGTLNSPFDDSTVAENINNRGQVIGRSVGHAGNTVHGFRTGSNATAINGATDDLTPNHPDADVFVGRHGLNDPGQVTGGFRARETQELRAFLTAPDAQLNPATDLLGTLGGARSIGSGINNDGVVVGESTTSSGATHAFIFVDGQMWDLNRLVHNPENWTLLSAKDINNRGQILVSAHQGEQPTDQIVSFLLTPTDKPAIIPLPAPLALGLVGLAGGAIVTRVRRCVR